MQTKIFFLFFSSTIDGARKREQNSVGSHYTFRLVFY